MKMHRVGKLLSCLALLVVLLLGGCFGQTTHTGALLVQYPGNQSVLVDGRVLGATNAPISGLTAGMHHVVVMDKDRVVWEDQVNIANGRTTTVTPAPEPGPAPEPEPTPQPQPSPQPTPEPPAPEPTPAPSPAPEPAPNPQPAPVDPNAYAASLIADFAARDAMPETTVPKSKWDSYGKYGPPAAHFPAPTIPAGYDRLQWQRDRIIAVAQKYIGKVPYQHKHIPSLGLDCSNFTAWVYNYGLGNKFTSSVTEQGATVGRRLGKNEPLLPGDLLFFQNSEGRITHAAIYYKPDYMIDESGDGVAVHKFTSSWYVKAFSHARRVIE